MFPLVQNVALFGRKIRGQKGVGGGDRPLRCFC